MFHTVTMPRSFALGATGSAGPARARALSGMRRPPPECRSREPLEPCAPGREPRKTGLTQDSSRGLYQCHLPRPLQRPPWRNERGSVDAALRGLPMAIAMRQLREDLRKLLEHAGPVVLLPGKQTVECMGSACPWHGWKSRRLAIGRAQRAWQKGVPELGVGYGSGAWQAAAVNLAVRHVKLERPPHPPRPAPPLPRRGHPHCPQTLTSTRIIGGKRASNARFVVPLGHCVLA